MAVHTEEIRGIATRTERRRSRRLEVRTTPEERALIDLAVTASGTDLTSFVVNNLTVAARRVPADRSELTLGPDERRVWEEIDRRPARDLPELREFMQRPSPFAEDDEPVSPAGPPQRTPDLDRPAQRLSRE